MIPKRGRGDVRTLSITNGLSKFTTLGRDSLLLISLGITSSADSLQIGLAFASGVAGVVGLSLAMAVTPTVAAARPDQERRLRLLITRCLLITILLTGLVIMFVTTWEYAESGKTQLVLAITGLFDACSAIAVAVGQARSDFAVPAVIMACKGGLFTLIVGGSFLVGNPIHSQGTLIRILATEAALVSLGLALRMRFVHYPKGLHTADGYEDTGKGQFRRRLLGAVACNLATSIALVISRSLAAAVPGGAAILTLAQRVVGIATSLLAQPVHAVVTPWLAEVGNSKTVRGPIQRFLFAFAVLVVSAALLVGALPSVNALNSDVGQMGTLVSLLLLAAGAMNFTGVALRHWLLEGRQGVITVSFLLYLAPFLILAVSPARGPVAVAATELISQYLQMLFAFRFSKLILEPREDVATDHLLAACLLPAAGMVVLMDTPPLISYGMGLIVLALLVGRAGSVGGIARNLSPRRPW
jgi:hypothetical protein